jgi:7,8-dihydroneopterin aldolase/epimerase/oxygenase
MGIIKVTGINLYAYHGCLEEEGRVGSKYVVNVTIDTDLRKASETDNLHDTVDYVTVYNIVKEEMAIRSKLIEHAGRRIIDRMRRELEGMKRAEVEVIKINPPMNGDVDSTSIILSTDGD